MGRRREARADDLDPLEAAAEQEGAAHEKRLDDGLSQLGELVHGPSQLVGAELEDVTVLGHPPGHQNGAAAEHVHVTGELSRAMNDHAMRSAARVFEDLHRAVLHHEEGQVTVALLEKELAGVDLAGVTAGGKCLEVFVAQSRKGNIVIIGHVVLLRV